MSLAQASSSQSPRRLRNDDFLEERRDLACAFRWAARLKMHESVANHFSLSVDEAGEHFLMNPCGRHFSRIRASELLLLDVNDRGVMDRPDAPDPTAWDLHGGIHRRLPQIRCILHVHSKYATALACLKDCRLPPIDQNTMRFFNRISVDEGFDGMGLGEEAERVCGQVDPDKPVLVMANHGVMVFGPSVGRAFDTLYYFERACETYVTALSTGKELRIASDAVAEKTARQWESYPNLGEDHFAALREILAEEEPDYLD